MLPRLEAEAKEWMRQGGKGAPIVAPLGKARDEAAAMFQVAHQYISEAKRDRAWAKRETPQRSESSPELPNQRRRD